MKGNRTFHEYYKRIKFKVMKKRPWIKGVELKVNREKDGRVAGLIYATSDFQTYRVEGEARSMETLVTMLLNKLLRTSREEKKRKVFYSKYLEAL
ncbi:MAG: hypothetical protein NXH75_01585 [Halobacteriovoraceae bacterium]|nr:hypothetical protein [Halobacteriovoraceae bacterium]